MPATMTDEYRQLGYDTSNDMIRYDSRRGIGEYAQAALHIRNAGFGRLRMGQMMHDAGEFVLAAENWLSAAACFLLATDPKEMQETLARAQQLDQEGKIPPERRDIHAAMKEREAELKELEQKLKRFQGRNTTTGLIPGHAASQEYLLDWLPAASSRNCRAYRIFTRRSPVRPHAFDSEGTLRTPLGLRGNRLNRVVRRS